MYMLRSSTSSNPAEADASRGNDITKCNYAARGIVVIAPAHRTEDPGFESRFRALYKLSKLNMHCYCVYLDKIIMLQKTEMQRQQGLKLAEKKTFTKSKKNIFFCRIAQG
jgi:hypothetical protein